MPPLVPHRLLPSGRLRQLPDDRVQAVHGAPVSVGFGGEETNHENWVKRHVLRGHDLDVVSVAWSPSERTVVTASLDSRSPVCVWDLSPGAPTVLSPSRTLGRAEHPCGCKGVAFDPTGSYFASTCDTPSLAVWSSLTMSPCAEAKDCFTGTQDLTMFRRLDWSPDGSTVSCTNCVVAGRSCATILGREGLSTLANLVGHKSAVCASRYSPDMFDFGAGQYGVYLASADKRGFVTVWSNKESRPVFKLQASARKLAVTDLSWKGDVLAISCLDGSVACVKFDLPDRLGPEARRKVFKDKYGSAGGVRNIDAMRMRAKEPKADER